MGWSGLTVDSEAATMADPPVRLPCSDFHTVARGRPASQCVNPAAPTLHIPLLSAACFLLRLRVVPSEQSPTAPTSTLDRAYLPLLALGDQQCPIRAAPLHRVPGRWHPSLLTPEQIGALLSRLDCQFGLAAGAEISMEMDPAASIQRRLTGVLAAGVTGVSLGGRASIRRAGDAGRRHRAPTCLKPPLAGQGAAAGVAGQLELELIQGLPQQDLNPGTNQLRQAVALTPPHLSI